MRFHRRPFGSDDAVHHLLSACSCWLGSDGSLDSAARSLAGPLIRPEDCYLPMPSPLARSSCQKMLLPRITIWRSVSGGAVRHPGVADPCRGTRSGGVVQCRWHKRKRPHAPRFASKPPLAITDETKISAGPTATRL